MNEFTACANGRVEDGRPHDFDDFQPELGGTPLMYCRRCGEVRRLALHLEEAGRTIVNTISVSGSGLDASVLATATTPKSEDMPR